MFFRQKTKQEKIDEAKEKYKDNNSALTMAIIEIEEVDKIKDSEEYYKRLIEVCAKHKLDFNIPN